MPLEHFFTPPRRRRSGIVRNHPLLVATTAASAGVVLGAYVAVQLLVTAPTKNDDAARQTVQAAAESKTVQTATESKAVRAETTGQAPSGDRDGTTTDCSRQTWPYLSRDCMELNKSAPRVVSTDKLDQPTVNAIENPPTPERTGPLPQASANASAVTTPPPAAAAATAASAAPAAPTTVPTAAPAQGGADQAAAGDLAPPKVTKTKHGMHRRGDQAWRLPGVSNARRIIHQSRQDTGLVADLVEMAEMAADVGVGNFADQRQHRRVHRIGSKQRCRGVEQAGAGHHRIGMLTSWCTAANALDVEPFAAPQARLIAPGIGRSI